MGLRSWMGSDLQESLRPPCGAPGGGVEIAPRPNVANGSLTDILASSS